MRRVATLVAVAAAAALTAGASGAASGDPTLIEAGGVRFPDRAYVVTLPSTRALAARDVVVTEGGMRVHGLSVVPASRAATGDFATVLVLDASLSMKGRATAAAMAAARGFAKHIPPNQQLAVITFNDSPKVVLGLTTDRAVMQRALSNRVRLAYGTHIYDAVDEALALIARARTRSASIVVLSDGSDTGSAATLRDITARARRAHVRIFAVGLRSGAYKPAPLRRLARDAAGGYAEASSADGLKAIYAALASELARQYLIQYRSTARPNKAVRVVVKVRGVDGHHTARYRSPALALNEAEPFRRSLAYRFWSSPLATLLVSFCVAGALSVLLILLLRPKPSTIRARMAQFVTVAEDADDGERRTPLSDALYGQTERSLARMAWWAKFKNDLDVAEIEMPASRIAVLTATCTLVLAWLLAAAASAALAILALAVPYVVHAVIKRKLSKKRKAFADQLPDNLQMLASALRAGHSFVGGLSVVVEDAAEPSRSEFQRVVADEQLGVPLEDALETVVRRMDNVDLEQVALVAALHRETGGNTAEVLERVTEVVRTRMELRDKVRALTAQGRMSRWVVSLLPVGLALILTTLNPEYMQPLFTEPFGRVLLVIACVMVTAGSLVIKRIVEIEI